ncbi:hypothetical protein Indivirus_11_15 [Indivirus ILV1]|uniref:Uncharacterized protein n=1 Tax=Indivirus ILV1 TaxID=1977633 RepID=A0A1V0SEF6_9VIRU|nr:hypothetical protein Indivirus_11_15 [Indivirus ILV1]
MQNTTDSNSVDISGLDKIELLQNLWNSTRTFGYGHLSGKTDGFNASAAPTAVKSYIDYFQGRPIKTDLSKDHADSRLYDRNAGLGTFFKAITRMQNAK